MNLETIMSKCEEVGDCIEWQGYYERNHPRASGQSVRRIVFELANGPVAKDLTRVVTMKCANTRCVNPEHLVYVPKSVVAKRTGAQGLFSSLVRKQRIAETRRKQSGSITMEIARSIRQSDRSAKDEAEHHKISLGMVYKIRSNESWREYRATPFAGLMA